MKKIYRKMMVLMNRKQKLKMVQILFMMVIGAVLETVSIGLVVPAIQMIMDPSCVEGDSVLAQIYRWTGFQKPGYFTTLILVLIIVMIVRSMFGAGAPAVVNTPIPQVTQQPQQENNFIVFGATNTPAPQLTATPNIEITPTPAPQVPAVTTYKTLRKGDRGKSVISMQEALIKLGYLKGASDGNFGTGTKTAVENFQKENGLDVDGIAGAKTLEKLYTLSDMTPMPDVDVTAAPGDILDLPG